MSTTISMWLGIAFTALAIGATVLQAWLWSFPMVPDPGGPDPNGKSTAPKHWTLAHRLMGSAYVIIYVVLMFEMIPRLWEYQVELPARTVMHASMGMIIGVLLITKIAIIRWFQHFGKALPSIGLGLLGSTLILAVFSIPFAVRAHDFGDAMSPKNISRVKHVLTAIEFDPPVEVDRLVTEDAFELGMDVLTTKCVKCHDMRTILSKPRTGDSWYNVVVRMAKKPTIGDRFFDHEIPAVTAYLVAITPDIQESYRLKKKDARAHARVSAAVNAEPAVSATPGRGPTGPLPPPAMSEEAGQELLNEKCVDCHEVAQLGEHGTDDKDGWAAVIKNMVDDEGAELTPEEAEKIISYLSTSPRYGWAPAAP